jgi:hypothetical protein
MTDAAEEQLYDVLIPPGVPRSIIADIIKRYDVKIVERKQQLSFANMDRDVRELLAFRGKLEVVQKVEKDMLEQLKAFVSKK